MENYFVLVGFGGITLVIETTQVATLQGRARRNGGNLLLSYLRRAAGPSPSGMSSSSSSSSVKFSQNACYNVGTKI